MDADIMRWYSEARTLAVEGKVLQMSLPVSQLEHSTVFDDVPGADDVFNAMLRRTNIQEIKDVGYSIGTVVALAQAKEAADKGDEQNFLYRVGEAFRYLAESRLGRRLDAAEDWVSADQFRTRVDEYHTLFDGAQDVPTAVVMLKGYVDEIAKEKLPVQDKITKIYVNTLKKLPTGSGGCTVTNN